ncbi:MAG TPA: SEC-C metal-binding domain-containing protein, partial [Planctomycetaceae bacterium]|nr:SEC-C metal-binding domain-containing protein [Planctomycetaceae bacterium]
FRTRIEFCESAIPRLEPDDSLTVGNFRRAIAESHAHLGDLSLAEQLFETWLTESPRWGWGWIGWSDLFGPFDPVERNLPKAEAILCRGLAVDDVEDRADLLERLAHLCEADGRESAAKEFQQQSEAERIRGREQRLAPIRQALEVMESKSVLRTKTTFDFGDEGLPLDQFADFARSVREHDSTSHLLDDESFDDLNDNVAPFADFPRLTSRKIGRNDPCYCGSGKKFKKCCGKLT